MSDSGSAAIAVRRFSNGSAKVEVSGTFTPSDLQNISGLLGASAIRAETSVLIETPSHIPHRFFKDLLQEINVAYSHQLYTSTWMCLRKLFENLIIEVLRTKFGTSELALYFWTEKGRFQDFGTLIENLELKTSDFRAYTPSLDQKFFDFLKTFRGTANSATHSIDTLSSPSLIENVKSEINHYTSLLCDLIRRVQNAR